MRKIYRRLELGEYDVPAEALKLVEDIQSLRITLDILYKIDPGTLSNDQQTGYLIRRKLILMVQAYVTFASEKLRITYLGGKRIKRKLEEPIFEIIMQRLNAINNSESDK